MHWKNRHFFALPKGHSYSADLLAVEAQGLPKGEKVARIESSGSVDGMPAKVVYYPDRRQHHIYWGGRGRPDGPGHNHMTIQDKNPDAIHFMRENGRVVVSQNPKEVGKIRWMDILVHAWRQNKRYWRWVNRNSPW